MLDTSAYSHTALTVEAADGGSYVVDMSGAQLGQHRPVITFDDFMEEHAVVVVEVNPHGKAAATAQETREGARNYQGLDPLDRPGIESFTDYGVGMLQHEIHKHFLAWVKDRELENKTSISELLCFDQKRYTLSSESLLAKAESTFKAFTAEWEANGRQVKTRMEQPSVQPDWLEDLPIPGQDYYASGSKACSRWMRDMSRQSLPREVSRAEFLKLAEQAEKMGMTN